MPNQKSSQPRAYRKAESYVGETFNRLTITRISGKGSRGRPIVECQCSCGKSHSGLLESIRSGDVKSCGCLRAEVLSLPTHLRPSTGRRQRKGCGQTPEARRATQEKWKRKNQDKVKATSKRFRDRHVEEIKVAKAAEYQKHKPSIIERYKRRYSTDAEFRLIELLRSRLRKTTKRGKMQERTLDFVGCTLGFLRDHIRSQFKAGMTWEAFLRAEIEIDHIHPIAAHDMSDSEQVKKAFHYTNLAPLWKPENQRKSDLLPDGTRGRLKRSSP